MRGVEGVLRRWSVEVFGLFNLDVEKAIKDLNVLDMVDAQQVDDARGNLDKKRLKAYNKAWIN